MNVLPVKSEQPTWGVPVANLTIIGLNLLVFLLELGLGDPFVARWAFVPAHLTAFLAGADGPFVLLTFVSAMFMHAGLAHLAGNMLFLWVFGQAIETAWGARPYASFYLVCGVAANLAQYAVAPASTVPNLGASGAIAGVMGAYLALYPTSTIDLFVWPLSLLIWRPWRAPAWLVLVIWFGVQLASGIGGLTAVGEGGGVAYWAHIGGFATGFVLALIVRPGRLRGAGSSIGAD